MNMPGSPYGLFVAVQLTPAGRGAIATIRVEGAGARDRVTPWLHRTAGAPITQWPRQGALHAFWHHEDGGHEEVVVFSGDSNWLEIHCHGGTASVGSILRTLEETGCEILCWSEWVRRQDLSTTRREAWMQLSLAPTEITAICLLDQFHGALDRELESLRAVPPPADALTRLQALAGTITIGRHLIQPWRCAFAGPPNVGKSSLINRLLGFQRSLVFDFPGTTRDVLRGNSAVAGWPIELIDTPGWLEMAEHWEQVGMELGQSAWTCADVRILVLDASDPTSLEWAGRVQSHLIAWNKIDLPSAVAPPHPSISVRRFLPVSALTGAHCEELVGEIACQLPAAPERNAPVIFTARQHEWIKRAVRCWIDKSLPAGQEALRQCQHGSLSPHCEPA